MIKIFIGFDSREKIAYHVLSESIREKCSLPVSICPISLNTIKHLFNRPLVENQSTEFAFSRFLVPFLCGYEGWAIFMDCDMLVNCDLSELWNLRDDKYSIMCCKHSYSSKIKNKFLGAKNQVYEKKNWSSMMLINNSKCKNLTLDYVNSASGLELHQFKWLESDNEIGSLDISWNWLVGEYDYIEAPKILHYTLGGPYFKKYNNCDYSSNWFSVYKRLNEINIV